MALVVFRAIFLLHQTSLEEGFGGGGGGGGGGGLPMCCTTTFFFLQIYNSMQNGRDAI